MAEKSLETGDAVCIRKEWAVGDHHYGIGIVIYKRTYAGEGTYFGVQWIHELTWHDYQELELISGCG